MPRFKGVAASWTAANPILADGELGYETDLKGVKFGDGVTPWNSLPYFNDWAVIPNRPATATGLVPSTLIMRDSNSNFSAGTPTVDAHVATKLYVDDGAVRGAGNGAGRNYKIVGCVVRNSGSGFQFINDSGHLPMNVSSISTAPDNLSFTINYTFTATKVVSLTATPDETLSTKGYIMGGSVGVSSSTFQVGQPGGWGDYVSYNGSAWTSLNGFVTSTTMNTTTGLITFNHDDMSYPIAGHVTGRSWTYRAVTDSLGATITSTYLVNNAGVTLKTPNVADCKFWVSRSGARRVKMDELDLANSNIWIYGIFQV